MKRNVFICPPCGESVAQATKEGQSKNNALWPLLPRLTAVLPPQGREMSFGFTLIELLVVVLIIGILAAVAVPQYTFAVEKARLSEALTVMSSLEKAIDVWLLEHGTPTETVFFLGNDVNGKGQLDIDFESGMDCSLYEGQACGNKNFLYEAYCSSDVCAVWAHRLVNGESNGDDPYNIVRAKKSSGGAWHGSECNYYPDVSAIGKKICDMLESQGDGYQACEDC